MLVNLFVNLCPYRRLFGKQFLGKSSIYFDDDECIGIYVFEHLTLNLLLRAGDFDPSDYRKKTD